MSSRCASPTAIGSTSRGCRSTCSTRRGTPTIPTASSWPTGCSPATRCSSAAPAAPISRTAIRARNTSSIFGRLLKLPDETLVYPAHDYKGDTVSTIGEEKAFNPRLQVKSVDEYVELMNNLKLPNPKMMDVAVPANMHVGLHQEEIARQGWALTARQALALRRRCQTSRSSICASAASASDTAPFQARCTCPIRTCRKTSALAACCTSWRTSTGKRLVFYCAFGERSAMAVQAAQDAGLASACHIQGGIDAWKKASGPTAQ